eukprot:683944-Pleurochrysis_carterae.AAC.2
MHTACTQLPNTNVAFESRCYCLQHPGMPWSLATPGAPTTAPRSQRFALAEGGGKGLSLAAAAIRQRAGIDARRSRMRFSLRSAAGGL